MFAPKGVAWGGGMLPFVAECGEEKYFANIRAPSSVPRMRMAWMENRVIPGDMVAVWIVFAKRPTLAVESHDDTMKRRPLQTDL
jgi:hypothetical protein